MEDKVFNTGEEFEKYIASLLKIDEIYVRLTPKSNDYGADIICEKDGKTVVIQCKYYSKPIGVHAVQEVVGALAYYRADIGAVVTNSIFTKQAKNLAEPNNIKLIDGFHTENIVKILFRGTTGDEAETETVHEEDIADNIPADNIPADNIPAGQENAIEEPLWTTKDLSARYGVSSSYIVSNLVRFGVPYELRGKRYLFNPTKVLDWEIQQCTIPFGRNDCIVLPGYTAYTNELRNSYKIAKAEKNKEEQKRIKSEAKKLGISLNDCYNTTVWIIFSILIPLLIAGFVIRRMIPYLNIIME